MRTTTATASIRTTKSKRATGGAVPFSFGARGWWSPSSSWRPSLKRSGRQGLTLVHFSAQREHSLSHVVGCFAGFSDKNGSGLAMMWTSVSPCWSVLNTIRQPINHLMVGPGSRGLHSSTFQLNLSALYGIRFVWDTGCASGLCSPYQGGVRGCLGCVGCFFVTGTAQVELKSERV